MIDFDSLIGLVTEDLVEGVLTELEEENPQYEGILPRHNIAHMIVQRTLHHMDVHLASEISEMENQDPLGFCRCLSPIEPETLDRGYCLNCGRSVYLRINKRTAL